MAKAGSTKEKILDTAFKIFMENGYEEASVRMILEESKATTGSFYYYFPSKEALFEAVIERYLQNYVSRIERIANDSALSSWEYLDALLLEIENGSNEYFSTLQGNKLHWSVQCALHEKTMRALLPSIQRMIEAKIADGTVKSKLNVDTLTLTIVLLRGVEGILHARPMKSIDKEQIASMKNSIKEYVSLILSGNDTTEGFQGECAVESGRVSNR
ncbi:MAG TPA: TetR/AcrR family transcriptional regulator [Thermoclostridium sp.]|nr:TetR/AcrR family transcriptional regulator [Thermoclostridium sp.]